MILFAATENADKQQGCSANKKRCGNAPKEIGMLKQL